MVCWLCQRRRPDRGGICQACRRTLLPDSRAPEVRTRFRSAAIGAALLIVALAVVAPALTSVPRFARHAAAHLATHKAARHPATETPVMYQTVMVVRQVKRKVYPYSMVPGGAENVHEARIEMSDPAVRAQYAAFNLDQLREEKLKTNLVGYVSYRMGDHIYWTAKKLTLRAGETVFTDGTHIARGRCLNCYSALPMSPVRPHEPTEKALDLPTEMPVTAYEFPKVPFYAPELPIPLGELTPIAPPIAAATGPGGAKPGGGFWFPIIPFIPPIHRHPGSPTTPATPGGPTGSTPPPPPPPVAVVPEPRYSMLLVGGFLALLLAKRRRLTRAQSKILSASASRNLSVE
jgi:hypothetical protein